MPTEFFNLRLFTFSNVTASGNYIKVTIYALLIFYTLLKMSLIVFFPFDIRFFKRNIMIKKKLNIYLPKKNYDQDQSVGKEENEREK